MFLRSAALIEGLRLDGPLRMGVMTLRPIAIEAGFPGRELLATLNDLLAEHNFVTEVDRPTWAAQIGARRRMCFLHMPAVEVEDVASAWRDVSRAIMGMVDALALTHGGSPAPFAAVHERSDDGRRWHPFVVSVGSGAWPGSVLDRLLAGDERLPPLGPETVWKRAMTDPRLALWLSLYRSCLQESRWDAKIFRCCALLEAIGRELLVQGEPVTDDQGRPLRDHGGQPATTASLRGLMYALVTDAAARVATSPRSVCCHASRSLWDEVGVWADVRNLVAHEGFWRPPGVPSTLEGLQRRSAAAFELAGRGDGLDPGSLRYADAVIAATELVLRARALVPTSSEGASSASTVSPVE